MIVRGRQNMGLDIFGLDVGNLLSTSGGQALNQFQSALVGQVAASPQVRAAVAQQGQQAAAQSLAEKILANKNLFVYGGIGIVGLLAIMVLKK